MKEVQEKQRIVLLDSTLSFELNQLWGQECECKMSNGHVLYGLRAVNECSVK